MKTDPVIMRDLEAKVSSLPGEADVTLPAQIMKDLLADARKGELLDITVDGDEGRAP